jgi:hypothetical protein
MHLLILHSLMARHFAAHALCAPVFCHPAFFHPAFRPCFASFEHGGHGGGGAIFVALFAGFGLLCVMAAKKN